MLPDHGYSSDVRPCQILGLGLGLGLEGKVRLLRLHCDFLGKEYCGSIVLKSNFIFLLTEESLCVSGSA